MKSLATAIALFVLIAAIGLSNAAAQVACSAISPVIDDRVGAGAACEKVFDSGGAPDLRIYVVEGKKPDNFETLLPHITQAAARSRQVFGRFAVMPAVDFVLVNATDAHDSEGDARPEPNTSRCVSLIYAPALFASDDINKATKFLTAHEMFHCFQFKNLYHQGGASGAKWWEEGSAEYFANVVYPDYDIEHQWLGVFSNAAETKPLTQMAYEAYVLFQYMENAGWSHGDIIDFLRATPTANGEQAQRAFLERHSGFASFYQSFAQDYYSGQIRDTNGGTLFGRRSDGELLQITESGRTTIDVKSFVFTPRMLLMRSAEDIKLESSFEGGEGLHRERFKGAWNELPRTVNITCEDPRWSLLVLTSVDTDTDQLQFHIDAVVEPCPQCVRAQHRDRCLIGRWAVSDATMVAFLESRLGQIGELDHIGEAWMQFNADGSGEAEITGASTRLKKKMTVGGSSNRRTITTETTMTLYGTSKFEWSTSDSGYLHSCPIEEDYKYDYQSWVDGIKVGEEYGRPVLDAGAAASAGNPSTGASAKPKVIPLPPLYLCRGSRAELNQLLPGLDEVLLIELNRQ